MTIKTIFLDRDGVINKEKGYLHKIKDFEFISGVFETCRYLQGLNYKIIIITNQSGISRGLYTENDFQIINNWMISEFKKNDINILDVFHCPHSPESNCNCIKPKPGMLIKAKNKYKIDMQNSWMLGDKESDIIAANNSGITNTIIVRSGHPINEIDSNAKFIINSINQTKNLF